MRATPLSPAIGILVEDIDRRDMTDQAVGKELRRLFDENAILLIRGQSLDETSLADVTTWLGPLTPRGRPTTVRREDSSFITKVSNIRENGRLIGSLPDGEMLFHADNSFKEVPNRASFLYAVEIPSVGGNTLFANLFRAYDNLPQRMRDRVAGLRAVQSYDYSTYETDAKAAGISEVRQAEHPLIFRHPATGRHVLFVNRLMTSRIVGLSDTDSRALLDELLTYTEDPAVIYEHVWRPGDFLAWDNLSSNHARTDFSPAERRLLLRGTTVGDYRPAA